MESSWAGAISSWCACWQIYLKEGGISEGFLLLTLMRPLGCRLTRQLYASLALSQSMHSSNELAGTLEKAGAEFKNP